MHFQVGQHMISCRLTVQLDNNIEAGAGQVQSCGKAPMALEADMGEHLGDVLPQLAQKVLFLRVHLGIFLLDTGHEIQDLLVNLHADVLELVEAEGP